jgi:hypothetical protein
MNFEVVTLLSICAGSLKAQTSLFPETLNICTYSPHYTLLLEHTQQQPSISIYYIQCALFSFSRIPPPMNQLVLSCQNRFWHSVCANLMSFKLLFYFILIPLYIFWISRVFINKILEGFWWVCKVLNMLVKYPSRFLFREAMSLLSFFTQSLNTSLQFACLLHAKLSATYTRDKQRF